MGASSTMCLTKTDFECQLPSFNTQNLAGKNLCHSIEATNILQGDGTNNLMGHPVDPQMTA